MKLSAEDIAEIKKVYAETGSYAETARRLHRSAATVKKYVSGEVPAHAKKRKMPISFILRTFLNDFLKMALLSRSPSTRLNSPIILSHGLSSPMLNAQR